MLGFILWLILLICYPEKLLSPWEIGDLCFGALIFVESPAILSNNLLSITVCVGSCVSQVSLMLELPNREMDCLSAVPTPLMFLAA
jgi:hypothetical protein